MMNDRFVCSLNGATMHTMLYGIYRWGFDDIFNPVKPTPQGVYVIQPSMELWSCSELFGCLPHRVNAVVDDFGNLKIVGK